MEKNPNSTHFKKEVYLWDLRLDWYKFGEREHLWIKSNHWTHMDCLESHFQMLCTTNPAWYQWKTNSDRD